MKQVIRSLSQVIGTEMIKARNTVALWLTLLFPLFSIFLTSLIAYSERDQLSPDMVSYINNFVSMVSFFLPFNTVFVISFFCQLEHRNSMFKHLYSLPVPRWALYFGKLGAALILLILSGILLIGLNYLAFFILGLISAKLRITSEFDHFYLITMISRTILSAFALLVIQYLLSIRFRNVIAAISIGISLIILPVALLIVLGVAGVLKNPKVLQWLPRWDPYSFPFSHVFKMNSGGTNHQEFYSHPLLIWFLAAIVLAIGGYFEQRRRNIK